MANITAAREMPLEGMPDAPDEEWLRAFLDQHNALGRQVVNAIQGQLTTEENTTSRTKTVDLVHGQSITVSNPLSVPIQGIYAIGCIGLETGSDGKPNGGIYDLAIPDIVAKPSTKSDGSWIVTAYYPTSGLSTGYVGERVESYNSTPVPITVSGTSYDITSIALAAGEWDVSFGGNFTNIAITGTSSRFWTNNTSATDPGNNGQQRAVTPTVPTAVAGVTLTIANYHVSTTTSRTQYLSAAMTFTAGAPTATGRISATRTQAYLTGRTGRVKLFFFGG